MTFPFMFTGTLPGPSSTGISMPSSEKTALRSRHTAGKHSSIQVPSTLFLAIELYFPAKFRKDGSPLTTHGRETQLYRKEQGRWHLVHVHYSGMPITAERQGF